MIVRTAAERPVIKAVLLADRQIVDAGVAHPHQAVFIELPVLVAVSTGTSCPIVMPFVSEANRDAVLVKGPEFLDQPIIELARPFPFQERLDRLPA